MGRHEGDKVKVRERDGAGRSRISLPQPRAATGCGFVGGTVPLETADAGRMRSASLVYDDAGRRVARYDKMHLFGFDGAGDERYDEARTLEPGAAAGRGRHAVRPARALGLLRCALSRAVPPLGEFDLIFVPSAFTVTTGRAHWETCCARAPIENLAYVVAPAQGGLHASGRRTYGHTMIVDPWGEVLAELARGRGRGCSPRSTAAGCASCAGSLPALVETGD